MADSSELGTSELDPITSPAPDRPRSPHAAFEPEEGAEQVILCLN